MFSISENTKFLYYWLTVKPEFWGPLILQPFWILYSVSSSLSLSGCAKSQQNGTIDSVLCSAEQTRWNLVEKLKNAFQMTPRFIWQFVIVSSRASWCTVVAGQGPWLRWSPKMSIQNCEWNNDSYNNRKVCAQNPLFPWQKHIQLIYSENKWVFDPLYIQPFPCNPTQIALRYIVRWSAYLCVIVWFSRPAHLKSPPFSMQQNMWKWERETEEGVLTYDSRLQGRSSVLDVLCWCCSRWSLTYNVIGVGEKNRKSFVS